jgi:hypothetical protein
MKGPFASYTLSNNTGLSTIADIAKHIIDEILDDMSKIKLENKIEFQSDELEPPPSKKS